MQVTLLSKKEQILKLLQIGSWITQHALNKISYRYGARIHELRKDYEIEIKQIQNPITKKYIPGAFVYRYLGKITK